MQAPDLPSVAWASLAIFTQIRQVARDLLQAKITREAQQRTRTEVTSCGPEASLAQVDTRTVGPETLLGEIMIPVADGSSATAAARRSGLTPGPWECQRSGRFPTMGAGCTAAGGGMAASPSAPFVRAVHGGTLRPYGAEGSIDSTAENLRTGQAVSRITEKGLIRAFDEMGRCMIPLPPGILYNSKMTGLLTVNAKPPLQSTRS